MKQMLTTRRAVLVALSSLLLTSACRSSSKVASSSIKQRVISVTPSTTEAMFAIGASHRLVGRSRYCDYPPQAQKIPSVGGYVDPSIEMILSLRPDLVIGARGPSGSSLVDTMKARGIECYFPPTESLDQVFDMIVGLGKLVGAQEQAEVVVKANKSLLQQIAREVQAKPKPKVLLVFGQSPIVVAGPNSFPDEMLRLAGCVNVMTSGTTYPMISFETMLELHPDVVIDATMAGGRNNTPIGPDRPGWENVPAVKMGHVTRIDDERILRPGPRVAEGVQVLATLVRKPAAQQ